MMAENFASTEPVSTKRPPLDWLPAGKRAAVCLSIDDVHPGTAAGGCDAGSDLAHGAFRNLLKLQSRHSEFKTTLCVTPDWRLNSLVPDSRVLRHIPGIRNRVHWTHRHPAGHFRLDRYPQLVTFLNSLPRCEVVPHGLTHSHVGPRFAVEFQDESEGRCSASVQRSLDILDSASLKYARGYVPPSWGAPPALIAALSRLEFEYLSSARDLDTPVSDQAVASMSGLRGVALIFPQFVGAHQLVHFTSNFQATSSFDRACQIVQCGGLLHIKAHIFKAGRGHVMLDGLDDLYTNYLDLLFTHLAAVYGDTLWWPTLSEVAQRFRTVA